MNYLYIFSLTLVLVLSAPLGLFAASPLPQGATVAAGSATFKNSSPNTLQVTTTSDKTIINYNSFNIASGYSAVFDQPGADAVVLNRVVGVDPSLIYGSLSSNGKLFLVNPNGVLFGRGSQVNAPALVASTLDVSNGDFLKGRYKFVQNGENSYVINQGRLAASPGGYIALLSQKIDNQGVIAAPLGSVALASGEQITVGLDTQSQISVAIDKAVKGQIFNSGNIKANGGTVLLTSKVLDNALGQAVNNTGVIEATAIRDKGGVVELISNGDIASSGTLTAGSLLERGNSFKVGGTFEPGIADIKNADNALEYSSNTDVSGTISDPGNIVVDPSVVMTETADTSFVAGTIFTMDPTSTINGGGFNLSLTAGLNSTLGNINDVNLMTLSSSASSNVTFTSNFSATFQVNMVKTNYLSALSRSVGTGTSTDPIMIYSDSDAPGGLQYIGDTKNNPSGTGLYYQQANNIDASDTSSWNNGAGFVPIGQYAVPFSGSFNGNNFVISNLTINSTLDYVGLFGFTSSVADLLNTRLANINITGVFNEGGLVGINEGNIRNSSSIGTVGGGIYVGGLVGSNNGTITNSYSNSNVNISTNTIDGEVGGLAGDNDGSISDSYSTGIVNGGGNEAGGLVGFNIKSINNSYSSANVNDAFEAGGLVGINLGNISNSYNTGSISSYGYNQGDLGGLVGYNYPSASISNSYNTGSVNGGYFTGGLVGNNYGPISNSFNTGIVSFSGYGAVGGLVGISNGSITNSGWWTGSAAQALGGLQHVGTVTYNESSPTAFYDPTLGIYTAGSTPWDISNSSGHTWIMTGLPHLQMEWSAAITNVHQLQMMLLNPTASYTLANVIDATETSQWNGGAGFTPIGNLTAPFTGKLNGNNFTVNNLFISLPTTDDVGLFGLTNGASSGTSISNTGLTNEHVTGHNNVGGLVGWNNSTNILNSYTQGAVTGNEITGGLVGLNNGSLPFGSISNSYSSATVNGGDDTGGLAGWNNGFGSIANSYATGAVTGNDFTGGLLGLNAGNLVSVNDSYATGPVQGNNFVGGLVGANTLIIGYTHATGSVKGNGDMVGGLVGWNYGIISSSYSTGAVTGDNVVGGLAGWNNAGAIVDSYASGQVSGTGLLGGLVGWNDSAQINRSYATGSVAGLAIEGGLVGFDYNLSTITSSYSTGTVTGANLNGGLIGYDDGSNTLTNNWWYDSLNNGIGNIGALQSTGHWQRASFTSDFYGSSFSVYTGKSAWDFTSFWNPPNGSYPTLRKN